MYILFYVEKNSLNDSLAKIKGELSLAYESLREVDSSKASTMGTLKSLERDITEIDEKMRKDEDRKVKIQKELDNLAKQRDQASGEAKKYIDEKEKLGAAITEK